MLRAASPAARVLLALCLLVFQAQILASDLLGCRHNGSWTGSAATGCPLHHTQTTGTGHATKPGRATQSPLGCAKCALHWAIGAIAPLQATPGPRSIAPSDAPLPRPQAHYYRFAPPPDFRPPIPGPLGTLS